MSENQSKIAAILQARMNSNRLPGKVLMDIENRPMLWHVVRRVKCASRLDEVIIATSTEPIDDPIAHFCEEHQIPIFRGSETNVLDRYFKTATTFSIETIVRITADCPMIDPTIINDVIDYFHSDNFDYASNVSPPTFPDGLDTEVFTIEALMDAWTNAKLPSDREHVTTYIRKNPDNQFRLGNMTNDTDLSHLRWTVDVISDLEFVRAVVNKLNGKPDFTMIEILNLLRKNPDLIDINSGHTRGEGYIMSLQNDTQIL